MSRPRMFPSALTLVGSVLLGGALVGCDDTEFNNVLGGGASFTEIALNDCASCHGGSSPAAGLDLEIDPCAATVGVQASGYDGVLVEPGDLDASVLWHKVNGSSEYGGVMPPLGLLDQESLDIIATWIESGAECDASESP